MRATRAPVAARERHLAGQPARHPIIDEVLGELAVFGVRPKLRFVWSIEGSGVEEEVPDVVHLHRTLLISPRIPGPVVALSERYTALTFRATVRHELGHALLFCKPTSSRSPQFRRLFGDVRTRYRVGTVLDEIGRRIRQHGGLANPRYRRVVSLYAASHPHEQFAEAVRVALSTGGDRARIADWVMRHDAGPHVLAQIRYAATWLATYGRR